MAYALCHGYSFCIVEGRENLAKSFNFPTCSSYVINNTKGEISFDRPINESGTYWFGYTNAIGLYSSVYDDMDCTFQPSTRTHWKEMILGAEQHYDDPNSVVHEDFFVKDANTVTVAVHIRRGDITQASRNDVFLSDELMVVAIQSVKDMLIKAGKEADIHIFSEDYGQTNWTTYTCEGLVTIENMHLVQKEIIESNKTQTMGGHPISMEMNIRDWKHFVNADILLVGSTFSRIPAYGRNDPDPETGLPLTISIIRKGERKQRQWDKAKSLLRSKKNIKRFFELREEWLIQQHLWRNITTFLVAGKDITFANLPQVWNITGVDDW